jgi:hypothetical protein
MIQKLQFSLGKGEVESSIPSGSTINIHQIKASVQVRPGTLAPIRREHGENARLVVAQFRHSGFSIRSRWVLGPTVPVCPGL